MKETIQTTEVVRRYHHNYTCSKCKNPCGPSEERGSFDIKEASIEMEEGSSFPEGGSKEKTIIDCCVQCFEDVVIPGLEQMGFKIRKEESDW